MKSIDWIYDLIRGKGTDEEIREVVLLDIYEENRIAEENRIPIFWGKASSESFIEPIHMIGCNDNLKNPYRESRNLRAYCSEADLTTDIVYIFTVKRGRLFSDVEILDSKEKWPFFGNVRKLEDILEFIIQNDCLPEYDEALRNKYYSLTASHAFEIFNEKYITVEDLQKREEELLGEIKGQKQEKERLEGEIAKLRKEKNKEESEYNGLYENRKKEEIRYNQIKDLTSFFSDGRMNKRPSTKPIVFDEKDNPYTVFKSRLDHDYKDNILIPFYMSLATTQIITLFGEPGTGKTTFVSKTAKALGAKCTILSVQNNWTDSSDLLGYYNPIGGEGKFESTAFVEALIDAFYDWLNYSNDSPLHFICLDEMNLARVEYYFAEFLSLLQREEKDRIVHLLPFHVQDEILEPFIGNSDEELDKIKEKILNDKEKRDKCRLGKYLDFLIPPNVRFIGTINNDDSTNPLSPKVRDRCFFLEITKDNYSPDKKYDAFSDHFSVSLFNTLDDGKDMEEFKNENARFNKYAREMWPLYKTIKTRATKKDFCQYLIKAKVLPMLQKRDEYPAKYPEAEYGDAWEAYTNHSKNSGTYYDYLGG